MSKKSKWLIAMVVFVVVYISFATLSWEDTIAKYENLAPERDSLTKVEAVVATHQPLNDWIYSEGTARAVKKVHLTFEVEGRVAEVANAKDGEPLREGSSVYGPDSSHDDKKGQLIARLDDKDYAEQVRIARGRVLQAKKEVDIAEAQFEQSKSRLSLAEARFKRVTSLRKKGASSKQALEEARAANTLARAEIRSSEARLASVKAAVKVAEDTQAQAQRNLNRTRIYAPWNGTIARLNIRKGEYVNPQSLNVSSDDAMTTTFPLTLVDDSRFEVSVEVPYFRRDDLIPGNIAYIQQGNAVKNSIDADWFEAQVYAVSPILSPGSRTIRVKVRTVEKQVGLQLSDGQLVKVKILQQQKEPLVIPVDALLYRENKPYVFVLNRNKKVELRWLSLGIREHNKIEIIKGLEAGELIVTKGRQRLIDNDRVQQINIQETGVK